jgi:hypothetical protein
MIENHKFAAKKEYPRYAKDVHSKVNIPMIEQGGTFCFAHSFISIILFCFVKSIMGTETMLTLFIPSFLT